MSRLQHFEDCKHSAEVQTLQGQRTRTKDKDKHYKGEVLLYENLLDVDRSVRLKKKMKGRCGLQK